jgi:hypothetical protein
MKLRLLYSLGLLCVSTLQADCILACHNDSCEWSFSVLSWCATSNECLVNGQLFTGCKENSDCLLTILPGTHYEIPFHKLWPILGSRNDLGFRWNRDFADEGNVAVFLDDVPATGEQCTRAFRANHISVSCPNLPPTLERLEFDFIPSKAGVTENIAMSIGVEDSECFAAHAGECD